MLKASFFNVAFHLSISDLFDRIKIQLNLLNEKKYLVVAAFWNWDDSPEWPHCLDISFDVIFIVFLEKLHVSFPHETVSPSTSRSLGNDISTTENLVT